MSRSIKSYLIKVIVCVTLVIVALSPIIFLKYIEYRVDELELNATRFCGNKVIIFRGDYYYWEGVAVFDCGIKSKKTYLINDENFKIVELESRDE